MQIVRRACVAQQHAFDLLTVGQFDQQLFGAINGLPVLANLHGPQPEIGRQCVAQCFGQIGHFVQSAGPACE